MLKYLQPEVIISPLHAALASVVFISLIMDFINGTVRIFDGSFLICKTLIPDLSTGDTETKNLLKYRDRAGRDNSLSRELRILDRLDYSRTNRLPYSINQSMLRPAIRKKLWQKKSSPYHPYCCNIIRMLQGQYSYSIFEK